MPLTDDLDRGAPWPPDDHRDRIARQHALALLARNRRDELLAAHPDLANRERDADAIIPYPSGRIIARTFASMLFGEDPTVTHDDEATRNAVTALATTNSLPALGAEAAHTQAVHGEVYLRPAWSIDADPDHAIIDTVAGARAVPRFAFGRLAEVAFITSWRLSKSDDYLRHIEYHERGGITHRAYRGTARNLGAPVSLAAWRQTRHLASGDSDTEAVLETGVDQLLPVHVPLGRDAESPHGVSALDGLEPLILGLHRLYTQEQHDAELAKRRIAVTRSALGYDRRPGAASFDRDRDLFVIDDAAAGPVGAEGNPVTPLEFTDDLAMRERIRGRLGDLLIAAGISPYTVLPEQTGSAVSGTARRLAQSLTVSTVSMAARYWQAALGTVLANALELEAARNLGRAPDTDVLAAIRDAKPTATLADGMIDDPVELASMVEELARADALSIRERVRRVNPSWTDDEVDSEVEAIRAELGPPATPEGGLTGDLTGVVDELLADADAEL